MKYLLGLSLLLSTSSFAQTLTGFSSSSAEKQKQAESFFLNQQESERYKNHLKALTKEPHIATSKANERVRDYMAEVMRKAGFQVEIFPYDIYLPVMPGSASAEIVEPIRIPLNNKEYIHKEDPFSSNSNLNFGYNAYSGSGDVTAEVVYANFARKEDFEKLQAMGISVKGKIVVARYGGNFRGYKATLLPPSSSSQTREIAAMLKASCILKVHSITKVVFNAAPCLHSTGLAIP